MSNEMHKMREALQRLGDVLDRLRDQLIVDLFLQSLKGDSTHPDRPQS